MSYGRQSSDCRIYVGNLPSNIREKEVEDLFFKYGRISNIDLKNRSPGPAFAFIEFEDRRDAEDAIYYRNGCDFDNCRLRVERPRGDGPRGGYSGGRRGGPPPRRSDYRCIISGLPSTGSWQDLKDHMREAGDVCYADVYRDGTGVVEFVREEDMRFACKSLDDTKFHSHEGDTSYIRVKTDYKGGRSRSRSRSPRRYSPRRSPRRSSYSPKRSRRSYSRSRSRSRSRGRDSRSRSHSR
ncbi:serine/arginine-rich splicing factor 1A-like [Acanthaster planci]|uniref:Serine/arginine-rich splicing factor 1A-like n=1 Tax=Acanthaster planci TaxID=133434 RepID=A0A8B7YB17_ACAPL|nr:serine/arginine-rich splicing factor 1A-like [Acanthaster planci]